MPDPVKALVDAGKTSTRTAPDTPTNGGESTFDASEFWRRRMSAAPNLVGTGTSGAPLDWQQWMYRGKVRAQRKLLARAGVSMSGRHVLDFGCGTGFFEDLWEEWGAARADGIDVVPELVAELQRNHSRRTYACADLSRDDALDLACFRGATVATMIDVAYHLVEDSRFEKALDRLLSIIPVGGFFLFTDMLKKARPAIHVRFRSLTEWEALLRGRGFSVVDREPVFVANNRVGRLVHAAPTLTGAAQHAADAILCRALPSLANNWAVLATRAGPPADRR